MKKIVVILLFLSAILSSHISYSDNPYTGKYHLRGSSGAILELKTNNTFTFYSEYGRTSHSISGKYTVDDNEVRLISNGNVPSIIDNLKAGKVQCSIITFFDYDSKINITFSKI